MFLFWRRGIIITIFHGFGTNCMVPSDWDSAPRCFCGPNFTSDWIGESPIFPAASNEEIALWSATTCWYVVKCLSQKRNQFNSKHRWYNILVTVTFIFKFNSGPYETTVNVLSNLSKCRFTTGQYKNWESTCSWPIRVRFLHPWADQGPTLVLIRWFVKLTWQVNLTSYNLSRDLKRGKRVGCQVNLSSQLVKLSSLSSGTCHRKWNLSPTKKWLTPAKNKLIIASASEKVFARFSGQFLVCSSLSKISVCGWTMWNMTVT